MILIHPPKTYKGNICMIWKIKILSWYSVFMCCIMLRIIRVGSFVIYLPSLSFCPTPSTFIIQGICTSMFLSVGFTGFCPICNWDVSVDSSYLLHHYFVRYISNVSWLRATSPFACSRCIRMGNFEIYDTTFLFPFLGKSSLSRQAYLYCLRLFCTLSNLIISILGACSGE